ncbi:hypothetical protein KEM60_00519 [Austwickia sp. TVS 96-490-7B]|uniref:phosphoserine phosphatase SerB n=1 Tax=Austwickia sp. TVS 96-490-7B TaxID=2830843 RepID=UPI001C568A61|nr:phosphoserine phosphatase SerB [Austwickia sp. TVS 96-490-7B]MBW3084332.1 hypothetical protein [Austwickia sp. TVS 96-490-7B]
MPAIIVRAAVPDQLDEGLLPDLTRVLTRSGGLSVSDCRVLSTSPGVIELTLDVPSPVLSDQVRQVCSDALHQLGVEADLCLPPSHLADLTCWPPERQLLVVTDVDSTLIAEEVIDMLAEQAGRRDQVARVTAAAMRGEIDFTQSLRSRVGALAGLEVTALEEVRRAVHLTPGARTLITVLHQWGHRIGAVSGGFLQVLDPLAVDIGLDYACANVLEVCLDDAGVARLTGDVEGSVVDPQRKADQLRRWAQEQRIDMADTVAIGDGANDLAMMAAAGLGVGFCAKESVKAAADTTISFPRLDVALHYLGFTDTQVESALQGTGVQRGD